LLSVLKHVLYIVCSFYKFVCMFELLCVFICFSFVLYVIFVLYLVFIVLYAMFDYLLHNVSCYLFLLYIYIYVKQGTCCDNAREQIIFMYV